MPSNEDLSKTLQIFELIKNSTEKTIIKDQILQIKM
jgi:hypothetical protein